MDEPRWLSEDEERAWRAYRRMRPLLDLQISRDLSRDSGLSDPDYDVLSNLTDTDDHRQRLTDLANKMLWTTSRLSHHISRMERRGLVARESVAVDGRGTVVALTEEGLRTIEEAAPAHVESVRRHLMDLLTDRQIRTLRDIAETVIDHFVEIDGGIPA